MKWLMGYLPDYNPSKRWFCGRTFLQVVKQLIESEEQNLKLGKISKYSPPNLTLVRLNILRGVRTVLLLPPDVNDFSLAELTEQIKEKTPYDLYRKLNDLMFPDFNIYYAISSR